MKELLMTIGSFTEEEVSAVESAAYPKFVPARTVFFNGHQVFNKLFYIKKGAVRCYRIINGDDFTYFFFFEREFVVDFESFLTDTDSLLCFETLTDTEFSILNKTDIYRLYGRYPRFEKLGRLMAEKAYLSAAGRLKQHQTDDLKTRYLTLLSKNPKLVQSVPQHYIASYLGVKPQSLSRVKAELAGKKY